MKNRLTLKYGEKTVEYAFGLGFIGEFIEESGIPLLELQTKLETNPYRTIPLLMFYSRKWATESKGAVYPFTLNEMIELIDGDGGITSKNTITFLGEFAKSMSKDVPEDKTEAKDGEKPKN